MLKAIGLLLLPLRLVLFVVWYVGLLVYPFVRMIWWLWIAVFVFGTFALGLVFLLAPDTDGLGDMFYFCLSYFGLAVAVESFFYIYPIVFEKDVQRWAKMNADGSKYSKEATIETEND